MGNWFQSDSCKSGGDMVADLLMLAMWVVYIPIMLIMALWIGLTFTQED